jgi:hypothetical protein
MTLPIANGCFNRNPSAVTRHFVEGGLREYANPPYSPVDNAVALSGSIFGLSRYPKPPLLGGGLFAYWGVGALMTPSPKVV